jgi:hypothetical protein
MIPDSLNSVCNTFQRPNFNFNDGVLILTVSPPFMDGVHCKKMSSFAPVAVSILSLYSFFYLFSFKAFPEYF